MAEAVLGAFPFGATLQAASRRPSNNVKHLGTLGTGNRFIVICLDEADAVWFMLHSGSRGAEPHRHLLHRLAREDMRRLKKNLPDIDLAYFTEGSRHFEDSVEAVDWVQEFAGANRRIMMERNRSSAAPPKPKSDRRDELILRSERLNDSPSAVARIDLLTGID